MMSLLGLAVVAFSSLFSVHLAKSDLARSRKSTLIWIAEHVTARPSSRPAK
jgi:hypothetical protein